MLIIFVMYISVCSGQLWVPSNFHGVGRETVDTATGTIKRLGADTEVTISVQSVPSILIQSRRNIIKVFPFNVTDIFYAIDTRIELIGSSDSSTGRLLAQEASTDGLFNCDVSATDPTGINTNLNFLLRQSDIFFLSVQFVNLLAAQTPTTFQVIVTGNYGMVNVLLQYASIDFPDRSPYPSASYHVELRETVDGRVQRLDKVVTSDTNEFRDLPFRRFNCDVAGRLVDLFPQLQPPVIQPPLSTQISSTSSSLLNTSVLETSTQSISGILNSTIMVSESVSAEFSRMQPSQMATPILQVTTASQGLSTVDLLSSVNTLPTTVPPLSTKLLTTPSPLDSTSSLNRLLSLSQDVVFSESTSVITNITPVLLATQISSITASTAAVAHSTISSSKTFFTSSVSSVSPQPLQSRTLTTEQPSVDTTQQSTPTSLRHLIATQSTLISRSTGLRLHSTISPPETLPTITNNIPSMRSSLQPSQSSISMTPRSLDTMTHLPTDVQQPTRTITAVFSSSQNVQTSMSVTSVEIISTTVSKTVTETLISSVSSKSPAISTVFVPRNSRIIFNMSSMSSLPSIASPSIKFTSIPSSEVTESFITTASMQSTSTHSPNTRNSSVSEKSTMELSPTGFAKTSINLHGSSSKMYFQTPSIRLSENPITISSSDIRSKSSERVYSSSVIVSAAEWSSWEGLECTRVDGSTIQTFTRKCIDQQGRRQDRSRCPGYEQKTGTCSLQANEQITVSKIAKVSGTLTVKNLTVNEQPITNDELKQILEVKGEPYRKLKNDTAKALFRWYTMNNVSVKEIIITNLTVGSLVIDYVCVLNTEGNENRTLSGINPIRRETSFFQGSSSFQATTAPQFSRVVDYNECKDKGACHKHAICINSLDAISFSCQCKHGFKGNGITCTEDNKDDDSDTNIVLVAVLVLTSILLVVFISVFSYLKMRGKHSKNEFNRRYNATQHFDEIRKEINKRTDKELINMARKDSNEKHIYTDIDHNRYSPDHHTNLYTGIDPKTRNTGGNREEPTTNDHIYMELDTSQ